MFSYPTVHTQQSSVPNGVAEHNVTVARAFTKLMGAFVTFWDNDAGQPPAIADAAGLQYPHNPMKGASEHFHFLSVLAGTYAQH